jgi:glycosyltransferase involved in cell wall biosynthesis
MDHYGIPSEKIEVVHNGIDPADYPGRESYDQGIMKLKKSGYKIVLFLGRITMQKGPDYFVKAAKKVLEYAPKTMFVVVGSGDMEGQMMQMASEYGISKNMLFIGFLRDEERSRIYHTADAYIMPSVSEPFGITALESLLHKTPVIMSKQSGSSEVILHALKTDFWDTDEIADKILSILTYPSLREEMTQNGEKEVNICTWDNAAKNLQRVYSKVLS